MRARRGVWGTVFTLLFLGSADVLACSGSGAPPDPKVVAAQAPDAFHWFDSAIAVAEARVTKDPGFTNEGHGHAGTVELTTAKVLKGAPAKTVSLQQAPTPCGGYSKGLRRVVFLDADAKVIGVAPIELVPALTQYGAATEPERRALVARWASQKDSLLAGAARKQQRP